jgi:adenosylmethionine-8-amino-7-oxononanoate aminotransferase
MSGTDQTDHTERLRALGERHLWMHFTRMGGLAAEPMNVIERGEGCWVVDRDGKRYLDGLAGLFTVQAGHGRTELAGGSGPQAEQARVLPHLGLRPPAGDRAGGPPGRARPRRPEPRLLHRPVGSRPSRRHGSWPASTSRRSANRPLQGDQPRRRLPRHHLGALAITGIPSPAHPSSPWRPASATCRTPTYLPAVGSRAHRPTRTSSEATADAIERAHRDGGSRRRSPRSSSNRCRTPAAASRRPPGYFARVREICDRYGVLLVSDEVICAYGRLGHMFGAERYGYQPDIITSAKGLTSGYSPLGAVLVSDRIMEPFLEDRRRSFAARHHVRRPPRELRRRARQPRPVRSATTSAATCAPNEDEFRTTLENLRDIPIVGDVRGDGYFWAIELVRTRPPRRRSTHEEAEDLLRGYLSPRLFDDGLICRADDRGEPVLQFSPAAHRRARGVRVPRRADRGVAPGPRLSDRSCSPG